MSCNFQFVHEIQLRLSDHVYVTNMQKKQNKYQL